MLENLRISHYHWTYARRIYILHDAICRQGENVTSADNQQERLDLKWIVGFVDGEGCFHVAINRISKMTLGYQVLPEFRIVQHKRDIDILKRIKETLGVGTIRRNHGDRFELRVRKLEELNEIVRLFEKYPLMTKKRMDFALFKEIIILMNNKEHLCQEGLRRIAVIAAQMNRQTRSLNLESSETICQNSNEE